MNQNELEDFFVKSATVMSEDRPDLWGYDEAYETITRWYDELNRLDENGSSAISSGGFGIYRHKDDEGSVEWMLNRNLYSIDFFESEGPLVFDWTDKSVFINP